MMAACMLFTCSQTAKAQALISEKYKCIHNLATALTLTAYYTITDSNEQNHNTTEWKIDAITIGNIAWRTALFGIINYYQSSWIPDHQGKVPQAEIKRIEWLMALAATTAGMLTYNSRFGKVVVNRYYDTKNALEPYVPESVATAISAGHIALRNVGWFYCFPLLLKPVNSWWYKTLPRQQVFAQWIYSKTASIILAHLVFSLIDALYQNGLVSIKHTLWQFLPKPSNLGILRFEDCTNCYLGTNLMGKNGPIGNVIKSLGDNNAHFVQSDVSNSFITTHTTQPYCGKSNPDCFFD